jgi:hypothetical protein
MFSIPDLRINGLWGDDLATLSPECRLAQLHQELQQRLQHQLNGLPHDPLPNRQPLLCLNASLWADAQELEQMCSRVNLSHWSFDLCRDLYVSSNEISVSGPDFCTLPLLQAYGLMEQVQTHTLLEALQGAIRATMDLDIGEEKCRNEITNKIEQCRNSEQHTSADKEESDHSS